MKSPGQRLIKEPKTNAKKIRKLIYSLSNYTIFPPPHLLIAQALVGGLYGGCDLRTRRDESAVVKAQLLLAHPRLQIVQHIPASGGQATLAASTEARSEIVSSRSSATRSGPVVLEDRKHYEILSAFEQCCVELGLQDASRAES